MQFFNACRGLYMVTQKQYLNIESKTVHIQHVSRVHLIKDMKSAQISCLLFLLNFEGKGETEGTTEKQRDQIKKYFIKFLFFCSSNNKKEKKRKKRRKEGKPKENHDHTFNHESRCHTKTCIKRLSSMQWKGRFILFSLFNFGPNRENTRETKNHAYTAYHIQ